MKRTNRLLVTTIAAALALPLAAFAAKGDRKNAAGPAPSFESIEKKDPKFITEKEYIAAIGKKLGDDVAKSQYTTLDKDHDGKLTSEEYAAAGTEKKKRKKKG